MAEIGVRHLGGDRFEIRVRDHALVVDQPETRGGTDTGPTPTELFVAGLASCVGFFAARFLDRHGLPSAGLAVTADYRMASDRPSRVERVSIRLTLPAGFPERRRAALRAVVEHCTVHESLIRAPQVAIELDAADTAA